MEKLCLWPREFTEIYVVTAEDYLTFKDLDPVFIKYYELPTMELKRNSLLILDDVTPHLAKLGSYMAQVRHRAIRVMALAHTFTPSQASARMAIAQFK